MCKTLRRLIETDSDLKLIIETINSYIYTGNSQIFQILSSERDLKISSIQSNFEFQPINLKSLQKEKELNKEGEDKQIEIYILYEKLLIQKQTEQSKIISEYKYETGWMSELCFLKAFAKYAQRKNNLKDLPETKALVYFDISKLDKENFMKTILIWKEIKNNNEDKELNNCLLYVGKAIMEGCQMAFEAGMWIQMQNLIKLLNNILINEMLKPNMHENTEFSSYLSVICMIINEMIKEIRKNAVGKDLEVDSQCLNSVYTKDIWFKELKNFDINCLGNVIAYTVSCLFYEEKWSVMVGIIRDFCNLTNHYYSSVLLPFLSHGQNIRYESAKQKTELKVEEFKKRTDEYEKWKVIIKYLIKII